MHGGRADQRHGTGVVEGLLEQGRGPVEITLFELDVAREESGLGESEALELAGLDLGFKFHQGAVVLARIHVGQAFADKFGLFGGGSLAGIAHLDYASDNHEHNGQCNKHLGSMLDKKLLNFRIILVCFVSHFGLPF